MFRFSGASGPLSQGCIFFVSCVYICGEAISKGTLLEFLGTKSWGWVASKVLRGQLFGQKLERCQGSDTGSIFVVPSGRKFESFFGEMPELQGWLKFG